MPSIFFFKENVFLKVQVASIENYFENWSIYIPESSVLLQNPKGIMRIIDPCLIMHKNNKTNTEWWKKLKKINDGHPSIWIFVIHKHDLT